MPNKLTVAIAALGVLTFASGAMADNTVRKSPTAAQSYASVQPAQSRLQPNRSFSNGRQYAGGSSSSGRGNYEMNPGAGG